MLKKFKRSLVKAWVNADSAVSHQLDRQKLRAHTQKSSNNPTRKHSRPFLAVISPVFDPGLTSLELLIKDLQRQTFTDFIHVSVSNGESPKIKKFIAKLSKGDPRFQYKEFPEEAAQNAKELFINICRRRSWALKKVSTDWYFLCDMDLQFIDPHFFETLHETVTQYQPEVIIHRLYYKKNIILPLKPLTQGNIDLANYSFSAKVAKTIPYPTDILNQKYQGNDFRFIQRVIEKHQPMYIHSLAAIKNGHNDFFTLTEQLAEEE